MSSGFGPAAEVSQAGTLTTVAWCNLCRAVGHDFTVDAERDDFMDVMQTHTELRHPEHEAALRRGEHYEPVEVEP